MLPPAQQKVLQCLAAGMTAEQTAEHLGLAPSTVKNQRRVVYRKLGARNDVDAVVRAVALNLVVLPSAAALWPAGPPGADVLDPRGQA